MEIIFFFLIFFLRTYKKENIQINVIVKIIQTFLALTKLTNMRLMIHHT